MIRLMRWLESALHRGRVASVARQGLSVACALLLAVPAVAADSEYGFSDLRPIAVFLDVHGAYQELLSVLRETTVIDESLRNEIDPYLHRRQINALLKRRDLLLNKYGARPGGGEGAAP